MVELLTAERSGKLYRLFGLVLSSELGLPELVLAGEAEYIDVQVVIGGTPRLEDEKAGYTVGRGGTLLIVPGVGRYWIENGRSIAVEPAKGCTERNLRLYLLGSALGALLHQRGLLSLHANAIAIAGRAVAFMGHSCAGKSTLAAWFQDHGFQVLADDVCVVTSQDGRHIVHKGIPRLRLWREALEASGRAIDDYDRSFDGLDKYNVPTRTDDLEPLELGGVYLLDKTAAGDRRIEISRLAGVEAVNALVANTYRGAVVPMIGATQRHLLACLDVVKQVPIFRAERPWGFDAFDEAASAMAAHAGARADMLIPAEA